MREYEITQVVLMGGGYYGCRAWTGHSLPPPLILKERISATPMPKVLEGTMTFQELASVTAALFGRGFSARHAIRPLTYKDSDMEAKGAKSKTELGQYDSPRIVINERAAECDKKHCITPKKLQKDLVYFSNRKLRDDPDRVFLAQVVPLAGSYTLICYPLVRRGFKGAVLAVSLQEDQLPHVSQRE
jgi:hypothetical protein